eukprot:gnl/MRDRNA2_/MRDRNA2_91855_c0_seq1.p1 gnl/MRDRNA2_/MRDRNA2_91855_c0~~gnl/MRDRNA2_/MRDRNA2_91855_c0_seq1.p1  ORF type:complete len:111 (+),score=3.50 gnl/MRDRNA2_/MRDRNA2_91855_c0_seq1:186-518(+)
MKILHCRYTSAYPINWQSVLTVSSSNAVSGLDCNSDLYISGRPKYRQQLHSHDQMCNFTPADRKDMLLCLVQKRRLINLGSPVEQSWRQVNQTSQESMTSERKVARVENV